MKDIIGALGICITVLLAGCATGDKLDHLIVSRIYLRVAKDVRSEPTARELKSVLYPFLRTRRYILDSESPYESVREHGARLKKFTGFEAGETVVEIWMPDNLSEPAFTDIRLSTRSMVLQSI